MRDDVLRLVHVGRLSREKSPHLAVATAVDLHRRGVPVRLDVYGTGPHRDELEEIAGGAPVVFHGHVAGREELADRIGEADIALSVCPGETFGLAVLEALACGTPVVTAAYGGARELVDDALRRLGRAGPGEPRRRGAGAGRRGRPRRRGRPPGPGRSSSAGAAPCARWSRCTPSGTLLAAGTWSCWEDWASSRPDRPGQGGDRADHQRRGDARSPRAGPRARSPAGPRSPAPPTATSARRARGGRAAGGDDRQAPQGVPRMDHRAEQHRARSARRRWPGHAPPGEPVGQRSATAAAMPERRPAHRWA